MEYFMNITEKQIQWKSLICWAFSVDVTIFLGAHLKKSWTPGRHFQNQFFFNSCKLSTSEQKNVKEELKSGEKK